MTLPVAILAGGTATRLRPMTDLLPKALVDVAGRPFVEHQLTWLRGEQVERVVFCIGYRGEMIREALGDGIRFGLSIEYVSDGERLLGTGGALRRALPTLGDAFFVLYGDSYLNCRLAEIEKAFRSGGRPGLMTVFRNENAWDRSNVRFENGRLLQYDKRNRTPEMRHIDYGVGILTPGALAAFSPGEPFDLADVYRRLLSSDDLTGFEVFERFYEIGSPEGLEETRRFLARRDEMSPPS
jgi:NDP-sugar pyrophosphorylase family protein